jgi:phosphate transport system substrate-binding protein
MSNNLEEWVITLKPKAITVVGSLAVLSIAALSAACGGGSTSSSTTTSSPVTAGGISSDVGKSDSANLTGAGATFPAPIYQAWFDDYKQKVSKKVQVNYQPVGSGAGVTQFTANTVDFGASDVGMSDAQLAAAPDAQLIPTVIGAVTLSYNLGGVASLKLDGPAIANIYLGVIKNWNDPALTALNPGVNLPNAPIQVAYRSDSSGTSGVFTDYLSKVSDTWKTQVGASTAPRWPVGQGGQGNAGVAAVVKQTPNSIGYIELTYALQNKLPFADVKNKAGKIITPSIDSASAAANGVTVPSPQYQISITNADGDTAYPISTFTYILLDRSSGKCTQQTPLVDMLWWVFHDPLAQQDVKDEFYAPLPASLLPRIEATLKALTCDGGSKPSLKSQ